MTKKYHTITDIVGTVYCEQKVLFDRERGDARPLPVRAKAAGGTFEHLRFQVEGRTWEALLALVHSNSAPAEFLYVRPMNAPL